MTSKNWCGICSDEKCRHIPEFCCMSCQNYSCMHMITSHKHYTIYELEATFVNLVLLMTPANTICISPYNENSETGKHRHFFKVMFKIFTTSMSNRKICYLIFTHTLQKQSGLFEVWLSLWKLNQIFWSRSSALNESYTSNKPSCLWGAVELLFLFEVHYPTTLLPIQCYNCPLLLRCVSRQPNKNRW